MTCFWKGVLKTLTVDDFKNAFGIKHIPKYKEFVNLLKQNNVKVTNVKCNGESLSDILLDEAMNHIKNINIKKLNEGYLCSCCDPVLILISQLFVININHDYNSTIIKYTNTKATKEINLRSNHNHMFSK